MKTLRAIRCPNCGAPLKLLGGGRVLSVTCQYCKSVIDLTKEDRVLANFKGVDPPVTFFKIGMEGKIYNICWRIIGLVVCKDRYGEKWNEFLLFSPYFGYAWLVDESDGKLYFSRRVRDLDLRDWARGINPPKTIKYKNRFFFQDDNPYGVFIEYVEGELTWVAKRGDKLYSWDYKSKDEFINIERTEIEVESYLTKPLNARKIEDSFKYPEERGCKDNLDEILNKENKNIKNYFKDKEDFLKDSKDLTSSKHIDDQEEEFEKNLKEEDRYALWSFYLYLFILVIYLFFGNGDVVANSKEKSLINFEVKNPKRYTHIYLDQTIGSGFENLKLELRNENQKEPLLEIKNSQIKYFKNIPTGFISPISRSIQMRLLLPTGKYQLKVESNQTINKKIVVGEVQKSYLKYLLWIFLIYLIILIFTKGDKLPEWFVLAFVVSLVVWAIL